MLLCTWYVIFALFFGILICQTQVDASCQVGIGKWKLPSKWTELRWSFSLRAGAPIRRPYTVSIDSGWYACEVLRTTQGIEEQALFISHTWISNAIWCNTKKTFFISVGVFVSLVERDFGVQKSMTNKSVFCNELVCQGLIGIGSLTLHWSKQGCHTSVWFVPGDTEGK